MMLISAIRATARPAPTATPLIAEMIGFSQANILKTMSPASFMVSGNLGGISTVSATQDRLPPAEKARSPAPVTTATRTAGSASTTPQILVSSQCRRPLVAFITSGRRSPCRRGRPSSLATSFQTLLSRP